MRNGGRWIGLSMLIACAANAPPPAEDKHASTPPPIPAPCVPVASAEPTASPAAAPVDVAAPPPDAKREASGLATKVIRAGTGSDSPTLNDMVVVHYTGWTTDGASFDSSRKRDKPATFPVSGVIKGWTQALQLMVIGEQRRVWIPSELAYGDKPKRPGAPAGPLVFDIELLEIKRAPPVPEDLTNPVGAKTTASGLRYRVLRRGMGRVHPTATDKVEVHYSGWTLDGKMFDSSSRREKPAQFHLNGVIKGWTEAVQLMAEGDLFRVWIPAALAYGDTPQREGGPAGELVFDIELLRILPPAPPPAP
jgi:FKBP-type peptidyl-prolyl cis-trans isomerase